jgi:hypothetical protein
LNSQIEKDPALKNLSRTELLEKLITGEIIYQFDFLNQIILESHRFQPPLGSSSSFKVLKDI